MNQRYKEDLTKLATLYLICFMLIILIIKIAEYRKGIPFFEIVHDIQSKCLIKCRKGSILGQTKGDGYLVGEPFNNLNKDECCFVSMWNFSHLLFYTLIGYLLPNLFWESFSVGILFELFEYKTGGCHDAFDIVCNTIGFLIGSRLSKC